MVDVGAKPATARAARARGAALMSREALAAVRDNTIRKGDVLGVARVAGIMAAKRTADLVPLCHQLPLANVGVELTVDESLPGVRAEATARAHASTGVEMEAIVAVSVALITVYDMVKAVDPAVTITDVCLVEKTGGRRGTYRRAAADGGP
jgi:cyclic pyranopterin phosphate synthase